MFKLGLLGTVIGFILMLGAVTDIRSKLSLTPNGSMIIF
jgi:flagellar motor component MotA